MTSSYATGKYSLFICDRCGEWRPYLLQYTELLQYKNIQGSLARTNLRLCESCVDTDTHVRTVHTDAQALRNPRPDQVEDPVLPPIDADLIDVTGLVWDTITNTWAPPAPNMTEPGDSTPVLPT